MIGGSCLSEPGAFRFGGVFSRKSGGSLIEPPRIYQKKPQQQPSSKITRSSSVADTDVSAKSGGGGEDSPPRMAHLETLEAKVGCCYFSTFF